MKSYFKYTALLRICCCLEERCLPFMTDLVTALVFRLTQTVKVRVLLAHFKVITLLTSNSTTGVLFLCQNPSKPQYNHFLFECLCLCIRLTCATDPAFIAHFESALFMIFQEILQQDITGEFYLSLKFNFLLDWQHSSDISTCARNRKLLTSTLNSLKSVT